MYARLWFSAGLVFCLAACTHQDDWETKNEIDDALEQISAATIDDYVNPDPDWGEDQVDAPQTIIDEFGEQVEVLPLSEDVYRGSARERVFEIERVDDRVLLIPRYEVSDLEALGVRDQQYLKALANELGGREDLQIVVTGHANRLPLSGNVKSKYGTNQQLSEARAKVVADFLKQELGVDETVVSYQGAGDSNPIASEMTLEGQSRNRRVEIEFTHRPDRVPIPRDAELPARFEPWWRALTTTQINSEATPSEREVEQLMLLALEHSSQIRVFSDIPLIRETAILEAEGAFDPRAFFEAKIRRANEPVGSTLKTGGPDRFREDEARVTGGIRKRTYTGADIEVSQRVGVVDSNSVFFDPEDQALTRLSLSVTQPLLNRSGFEYNRSTVRIAKLDAEIALDEFQRQVESHLLEVVRSYWSLYFERASLLMRTRLIDRTERLVAELESRRGIDVLESQIAQARSALAARRAATIRGSLAVRNAEAKLVSLINDPALRLSEDFELVTKSTPISKLKAINPRVAAGHSLQNRPEIGQALKQLRAGMVRLKMSENELLPALDLLFGITWDGLEGDYSAGRALRTQVDEGSPSLEVGLILDVPLGNRTAKARHERRRLEVRQLTNQLRATIETLLLEVQVSVREVNTAFRELDSKYQAMLATNEELEAVERRGVLGDVDGALRSLILDELLSAQERVTDAEQDFLSSLVTYNVALTNLDRSMGVLMQTRDIEPHRLDDDDGLPRLQLSAP